LLRRHARSVQDATDEHRPQHPATHGTLRLKVELDGELIAKMDRNRVPAHGFEKLAEYRNNNQFMVVTDRMNYLSHRQQQHRLRAGVRSFSGQRPAAGQVIRVIMAELSAGRSRRQRGLAGDGPRRILGDAVTFIEREKLYDIFEAVTGARLTTS
jgi:NADH-quinone oxidoreductase subunit D